MHFCLWILPDIRDTLNSQKSILVLLWTFQQRYFAHRIISVGCRFESVRRLAAGTQRGSGGGGDSYCAGLCVALVKRTAFRENRTVLTSSVRLSNYTRFASSSLSLFVLICGARSVQSGKWGWREVFKASLCCIVVLDCGTQSKVDSLSLCDRNLLNGCSISNSLKATTFAIKVLSIAQQTTSPSPPNKKKALIATYAHGLAILIIVKWL